MKVRFYFTAVLLFIFFLCSPAGAVPYKWVDVVDPDKEIYFSKEGAGGVQEYKYQHDITDDGFDPWPEDYVKCYNLVIDVYDDGDRKGEWLRINLPGKMSDKEVEVDFSDIDLGMSIKGWISLNLHGVLDVTLKRLCGDFYFNSSTLTAWGCESNPAPVPEPSTMLLLGTGIAGLVGFGRKKLKA